MNVLTRFELRKKVAIITGGYGHLGKSITNALAQAGATTVVCGKSIEKFKEVFNDKNGGENIHFMKGDISSASSIKGAFDKIRKKFGKIDILVNNAVYLRGNSPENLTDEEWRYSIDGVLGGTFRCMRDVLPHMRENKGGNIINISSMYGFVSPDFAIYKDNPGFLNPPHYGAGKAGIIQLTKYYAVYLAKYNIRVNCISPGAFPSFEAQKKKAFIKKLIQKIPLSRIGRPEDLQGAVIFLASDVSSFITGQNIIIDGGWTVR